MNVRLETQRLILRKPKISDWKDIVDGCKEIDVTRYLTVVPHPYKKKDALFWIKKSIKEWGKKGYPFIIQLKSENKVIGCMDIHRIDFDSGKALTGSWINKKYWRKGYITEAKIAVNNFAFDKLKLRKLNSGVFVDNEASNKTQQRMGYKLEGVLREESKSLATGKIHNINIYGLLKREWKRNLPKVKKRLNEKVKKLEAVKK